MSDIFQNVSKALLDLEERPQFGAPPFPWQELEKALCNRFQQSVFTISHREKGWVSFDAFSGVLKETAPLAIYVSHIDIPCFWYMGKEDVQALIPAFFGGKETSVYFLEQPLYEGLFHFFSLEVLSEIDHLRFGEHVTFHLGHLPDNFREILEKEPHFEIDITATLSQYVLHGSLLIPASFRSAWKKSFSGLASTSRLKELEGTIEVEIALEIGHVGLTIQELEQLKLGDFIRLDHCSYHPDEREGWTALSLGGENIFRGRLKKEGIKLLEYPQLEKGRKEMEENELGEEKIIEESEGLQNTSFVEKLPLHLVVEIGRLKMTIEEISQLSAGSMLELPVAVEEGVDLVINGKKWGKGELLKIGDLVGVRITKLG